MIYVCFAYGMPGCLPNLQDYECYANEDDAWRGIHQRLSNWRDEEESPAFLYPMTPQQIRNWFDGSVTFESHELGRSRTTGENICVILMTEADWRREAGFDTGEWIDFDEHEREPINKPDYMGVPVLPEEPSDYDMHEALDRVSMIMDTWTRYVCDAKAIQANRAWCQLACNIEEMMHDLYQMIGEKHL